jgi:hypothetical protein
MNAQRVVITRPVDKADTHSVENIFNNDSIQNTQSQLVDLVLTSLPFRKGIKGWVSPSDGALPEVFQQLT